MAFDDDRHRGGTSTGTEGPRPRRIRKNGEPEPAGPMPREHAWFVGTYSVYVAALLVAAGAVGLVLSLFGGSASRADWSYAQDGQRAHRACTGQLINQLDAPDSAQVPAWDDDAVRGVRTDRSGEVITVRIESHVDALDQFGSMVREAWSCEVEDSRNESLVTELQLGPAEGSAISR